MIEAALKNAARIHAQKLHMDEGSVYALMLIGAKIAFETNNADRLAAEHGPGSESIRAGALRIIPLPVHPKNL